jgi:hypothetical protein
LRSKAVSPLRSATAVQIFHGRLRGAISQLRHILRRFFYEETRNPRIIEKTSWFLGFLIELFLVAAWPRAPLLPGVFALIGIAETHRQDACATIYLSAAVPTGNIRP